MNLFLHSLLCQYFTKKLTHVRQNHYLNKRIILYPLSLLSLYCIIHSLILIFFSSFNMFLRILWNHVGSSFKLITLKLLFWIWIQRIQVIFILHLSPDTHLTVTFVIILLVGGPYGMNIKIIKIMSLYMVLECCLAQNVNLILANTAFGQTLHLTDSS